MSNLDELPDGIVVFQFFKQKTCSSQAESATGEVQPEYEGSDNKITGTRKEEEVFTIKVQQNVAKHVGYDGSKAHKSRAGCEDRTLRTRSPKRKVQRHKMKTTTKDVSVIQPHVAKQGKCTGLEVDRSKAGYRTRSVRTRRLMCKAQWCMTDNTTEENGRHNKTAISAEEKSEYDDLEIDRSKVCGRTRIIQKHRPKRKTIWRKTETTTEDCGNDKTADSAELSSVNVELNKTNCTENDSIKTVRSTNTLDSKSIRLKRNWKMKTAKQKMVESVKNRRHSNTTDRTEVLNITNKGARPAKKYITGTNYATIVGRKIQDSNTTDRTEALNIINETSPLKSKPSSIISRKCIAGKNKTYKIRDMGVEHFAQSNERMDSDDENSAVLGMKNNYSGNSVGEKYTVMKNRKTNENSSINEALVNNNDFIDNENVIVAQPEKLHDNHVELTEINDLAEERAKETIQKKCKSGVLSQAENFNENDMESIETFDNVQNTTKKKFKLGISTESVNICANDFELKEDFGNLNNKMKKKCKNGILSQPENLNENDMKLMEAVGNDAENTRDTTGKKCKILCAGDLELTEEFGTENVIVDNEMEELGTEHVIPCVYCDGMFKSHPQWLGHALKEHQDVVQRDPNQRDGVQRKCPYCVMWFWRVNRLIR